MVSNGSKAEMNGNGHVNGNDLMNGQRKALGGCHWLPWESKFIQTTMPDPTRVFAFLVCTIMFFRYLEQVQWDFSKMIFGFLLNPFVVSFSVIASCTFYWGLKKASHGQSLLHTWQSMPVFDRWIVEWYWWNAWLFHGVMDGAAGTLQAVPLVLAQYRVLDRRFENFHSVPWAVGLVEILIMQPVCLCAMYAILTKSPYRFPLEILASTLHAFGAVMFVFAEVYEGQFNVPALDPVGVPGNRFGNVKPFSVYQFIYYWFGFWFCNCIWLWVPFLRIQRALAECARAFQMAEQNSHASKKAL